MGKGLSKITIKPFGKTNEGKEVLIYSLINKDLKVDICNYGGIVVRLFSPDRNGEFDDIVLGYNHLEKYLEDSPYFGAIIGRYANRIAGAEFKINGDKIELAPNEKGDNYCNHLHGGIKGFDKVIWESEPLIEKNEPGLILNYFSKDGEEGYPGNLKVKVIYKLTDENSLKIEYRAKTDKPTPVNLTHHSYFNLKGEGNGDIHNHRLFLNADNFTPVNKDLIPKGEIVSVKGTPFDFTEPVRIGERIDADHRQLKIAGGYDHNFVLNTKKENNNLAARVYEPLTGRKMEVWTTEPGIQFYSGNFLEGQRGKSNSEYDKRAGFCLETQHYPDSPNKEHFPSTILKPDEEYYTVTEYKFFTD